MCLPMFLTISRWCSCFTSAPTIWPNKKVQKLPQQQIVETSVRGKVKLVPVRTLMQGERALVRRVAAMRTGKLSRWDVVCVAKLSALYSVILPEVVLLPLLAQLCIYVWSCVPSLCRLRLGNVVTSFQVSMRNEDKEKPRLVVNFCTVLP